jgi:hypothetical protein
MHVAVALQHATLGVEVRVALRKLAQRPNERDGDERQVGERSVVDFVEVLAQGFR